MGGGEITLSSPSAIKEQRFSLKCSINFFFPDRCISLEGPLSNAESFVLNEIFSFAFVSDRWQSQGGKITVSFIAYQLIIIPKLFQKLAH